MTHIRLNMIVKNEAARIERCLHSVLPHISSWAIVDTGSTDGTQDIVFRVLQDIPGDIKDEPFENFEQARNAALQYAQRTINNGPVYPSVSSLPLDYEYILFVDADMEMIVDDDTVFDHLIAPA